MKTGPHHRQNWHIEDNLTLFQENGPFRQNQSVATGGKKAATQSGGTSKKNQPFRCFQQVRGV